MNDHLFCRCRDCLWMDAHGFASGKKFGPRAEAIASFVIAAAVLLAVALTFGGSS